MRVLFVVPNVPSRIRARPFNLIRALSRNHEVSVLCLASTKSEVLLLPELVQYCRSVEVIDLPRLASFWNSFVALLSSRIVRYAYFHSERLRLRLNEKIARREIDVVHVEHLKSFSMIEDVIGRCPTVFDAVDCVSFFEFRRKAILRNPLLKVFSWIEGKKMRSCETKAVTRFNQMVITSPIDKRAYPAPDDLKKKIHVIPNGVDLAYFDFQQVQAQTNLLVFCAKLDYFANVDAALYFTESIWPRLRARRPDLRLEIVGSRPPYSLRRLNKKDNISIIGSVPDVRPFLRRAWVALCPVRVQAGVQNKILEAMALGVPIVVTSICCLGLGLVPGKHVLVADSPHEFVQAIELVLEDTSLRASLIDEARKFVESTYDWDRSAEQLTHVYELARANFIMAKSETVAVS